MSSSVGDSLSALIEFAFGEIELTEDYSQGELSIKEGKRMDLGGKKDRLVRLMLNNDLRLNPGIETSVVSQVDGVVKTIVAAGVDTNYPRGYVEIEPENKVPAGIIAPGGFIVTSIILVSPLSRDPVDP